jgi:hypothetical protein
MADGINHLTATTTEFQNKLTDKSITNRRTHQILSASDSAFALLGREYLAAVKPS